MRGWVGRLSMLWVVIGAGGAGYVFVCTMQGCTTSQCINDEFWFPLYNGEPGVIAAVGGLAAGVWVLVAVPLLVAGLVRVRGWGPRNWLRAAAWAGAWVTGFALFGLAVFSGWAWASGSGAPSVAWGELPIFALWLVLGAVMTQILAAPARGSGLRAAELDEPGET